MDFFSAQDHARRSSRWLLLWFALAVVGIIGVVYVTTALSLHFFTNDPFNPTSPWSPELFIGVLLSVGGLIAGGSAWKIAVLARSGGARIAEELGGRLVERSTTHPLERRLVNVVEEMAIASGIPAPPVYVLDAEGGINAFAAGASPNEAVVAVTRGTLEQLSRDELQGVIAHEFSHILNGDMRLNLRLVGVLHGILLLTLAGRTLMRGARGGGRNGGAFAISGLVLVVAGYIGTLCGKIIKAGVSRQREYLADASAVQFTRNPSGIAGALARIADVGSGVEHPRAEEASHMFFGTGARFSKMLATHPPIDERIRRIDPVFRTRKRIQERAAASRDESAASSEGIAGLSASTVGASVGSVSPQDVLAGSALIAGLPDGLLDTLHSPHGARATMFALLLSRTDEIRRQQLTAISERLGEEAASQCEKVTATLVRLPAGERLPLLDLALPALREFRPPDRQVLVELADTLIRADGRTSPFEYVARRLLKAALLPPAASHGAAPSPAALREGTYALLALLARAGHADAAQARAAFEAARVRTPFDTPAEFDEQTARLPTEDLDRVLDALAATQPLFRRKLVEACATAVLHDAHVTPSELELLRAICQALDCPLPLLLGQTST
ncbi:MAG: M48 family metallopeptidase [Pseudazoarcus pumilus]|nr:M48 family metallopeptidase [Pseudazoarcus pumilus]